jgi:hypothetical protein
MICSSIERRQFTYDFLAWFKNCENRVTDAAEVLSL